MHYLPTVRLCVLLGLGPGAFVFAQSPEISVDLGKGISLQMVLIQPGTFTQGSPATEKGRKDDELQREVKITSRYYMGVTPVTKGQFARFVEATHFRTEAELGPSGGFGVVNGKLEQRPIFNWRNPGFSQSDEDPVVIITYNDAQAFIHWFSLRANRPTELPTEAQWEYAVRAGSKGERYADPLEKVAWYRTNSGGTTHPLGKGTANAWGIKDAYGPVWQWCRDWYEPYEAGLATNPFQLNPSTPNKPRKVLRGGSFLSDVSHSRSAERYRNEPKSRNADNGFRIICSTDLLVEPSSSTK